MFIMHKTFAFEEFKKDISTTTYQPIINLKTAEVIGCEAFNPLFLSSKPASEKTIAVLKEQNEVRRMIEVAIRKATGFGVDTLFFDMPPYKSFHSNISCISFGMDLAERDESMKLNLEPKCGIDLNQACATRFSIRRSFTLKSSGSKRGRCPDYLKLGRSIVCDIDKNPLSKSLVRFLSVSTGFNNTFLIAEGVSTAQELETLIGLGVFAAQGDYLAQPALFLPKINQNALHIIRNSSAAGSFDSTCEIGRLSRSVTPFSIDGNMKALKHIVQTENVRFVCVLRDNKIIGMIADNLIKSFTRKAGFLFSQKSKLQSLIDTNCLIVDSCMPIKEVAELVVKRPVEKANDDVVVTSNGKYCGMVSVNGILKFIIQIQFPMAVELNPLTKLPGNFSIKNRIASSIRTGAETCILYFDLNNFKVYNDQYGFELGDSLIIMAKNVICNTFAEMCKPRYFIGHIGGDDFIAVFESSAEECTHICKAIITGFDKKVKQFYKKEDITNGYILSYGRDNVKRRYPLTQIAVAGVWGRLDTFESTEEISLFISDIKKMVKNCCKSAYGIQILPNGAFLTSFNAK